VDALKEVREALSKLLNDEGKFSIVNSRLILRTGVNLRSIAPEHDRNATMVNKVKQALHEMGYDLGGRDE
jgi:hypothetical protein